MSRWKPGQCETAATKSLSPAVATRPVAPAEKMACAGKVTQTIVSLFEGVVNASPLEETMEPRPRPRPFLSAVAFNSISTFSREHAGRRSATAGANAGSPLFFSAHNGFCLLAEPTCEIQSKLGRSILSIAGARVGWSEPRSTQEQRRRKTAKATVPQEMYEKKE